MISKTISKWILPTLAATALVVGGAGFVSAEQSGETANTLKVSPLRTDVIADPGETKVVKITVTNPTNKEIAVKPIQNDFEAAEGEDGSPAIILDEDKYASKHSLKRFLQPLENFNIPAGEAKTIEATIVVPGNAEAGGYFGAVRFAPTDPDTGGQVNMSASVSSLLLLSVRGDIPEKLELTDFITKQGEKVSGFFTSSDNISVMARFQNTSKRQLGPFGKISVKKGNQVVYETDFNNKYPKDVILPDSARRWTVPLKDIDGFGHYKVVATFTYGSKNQTIEVAQGFWVVPISFIVGGVALLLVVVGAIVYLVYRRRSGSSVKLK